MSQLKDSFNTLCPLCVCDGLFGKAYPILGCSACHSTGTIIIAYAPAELAGMYSDLPLSDYTELVQQDGNISGTCMNLIRCTRSIGKSTAMRIPQ